MHIYLIVFTVHDLCLIRACAGRERNLTLGLRLLDCHTFIYIYVCDE